MKSAVIRPQAMIAPMLGMIMFDKNVPNSLDMDARAHAAGWRVSPELAWSSSSFSRNRTDGL